MSDKLHGDVKADRASVMLPILLLKTADSTPHTGVVAADVTASYWRQGGVRVAITPIDLGAINSAYLAGGWKEDDAADQPGLYRFDVPDAAVAGGADWVMVTIKTAMSFYHERFAIESAGDAEVYSRLGAPTLASIAADVASRLATSGYAAPDNVGIAAVKAKTDALPAQPAAVGAAMTLTAGERGAIAAALLDLADGIEPGETPRQFARKLRAVALGISTAAGVFRRKDGATTSLTVTLDGAGARTSVADGSN